jgi:hypothetical protein
VLAGFTMRIAEITVMQFRVRVAVIALIIGESLLMQFTGASLVMPPSPG